MKTGLYRTRTKCFKLPSVARSGSQLIGCGAPTMLIWKISEIWQSTMLIAGITTVTNNAKSRMINLKRSTTS